MAIEISPISNKRCFFLITPFSLCELARNTVPAATGVTIHSYAEILRTGPKFMSMPSLPLTITTSSITIKETMISHNDNPKANTCFVLSLKK